jgi:hypothetical protein
MDTTLQADQPTGRGPVPGWPDRPVIYEVNTAVWLSELSRQAGRRVTLDGVTAADWDTVTPDGVDAVWLMGVWERSPAGAAIAAADAGVLASFRAALPDLQPGDLLGSPYCVRRYRADPAFGGPEGLAAARAALAAREVRLILDYVPNHVAPDHPWIDSHPDFFIRGDEHDLATDPGGWTMAGGRVLAHGRDPYFPSWTDTVQLNAYSPALRAATADTLAAIAGQCDGIRCDMAMLLVNRVFGHTWGGRAGPEPATDFWPAVLGELRRGHPRTVFIAEAYWDMEAELQQQGFQFCYDKRLYDRIVDGDPAALREHLGADVAYQDRLLRFLENHDEPRAAGRLRPGAGRAVAVALATLPGATMWHDGQFEGRRVRVPVQLARRPAEQPDLALAEWYRHLLATLRRHRVRSGSWQLLEVTGWPDNQSSRNLLAWSWDGAPGEARHLVVVNFSGQPAQGRIPLAWPGLADRQWRLADLLSHRVFERDGGELADPGLYVGLDPWGTHLLTVSR